MKDINKNSRILYDLTETSNQKITSEMPIKYITDEINKTRYLEHPNMYDINIENSIRMKPTNLNENVRDNIFLSGTAPYRGLHDGPVDDESSLFFGEVSAMASCSRTNMMETNMNSYTLDDPFKLQNQAPVFEPSVSTRNIYRNKYFKNKNQ